MASRNHWSVAQLNRREFLRVAAAMGASTAALSLAACGGGTSSTPATSGGTATTSGSGPAATKASSPAVIATQASGSSVSGASSASGNSTPTTLANSATASAASSTAPAAKNQVVIYTDQASPRSTDPANALESNSLHVVRAAYEGLVANVTGTTEIQPRLATGWKVSDDAQSYTFMLRQGVKFHDGTTMDATAVKKSYDRVKQLNLGPAALLDAVDQVKVLDDHTVQIILKRPHAYFMSYVPKIGIVSPTAWEQHDKGGDLGAAWLEANTAGTGPFKLTELKRNESTTLDRFDGYWRGWAGNHLTRIQIPVVPEPTTRAQMLESGDAHFTPQLSAEDVQRLKGKPGINVMISKNFEIDIITMNVAKPPLNDPRVRKAMQYAFDYQGYLDKVLLGNGNLPTGPIAPDYPSFNPALPPFKQDLAKAKQLLADAGATDLSLDANFVNTLVGEQQSANILQSSLKQIGVTLNLKPLPWATIFKIMGSKEDAMPMSNLLMSTFTADPTFTLNQNYGTSFVGKPYNWSYYSNDAAQKLIDQAAGTLDNQKSYQLLQQAQQLIIDDAPAIFYANPKAVEAVSSKVQNYVWDPVDYYWQVDWYNIYLSQ